MQDGVYSAQQLEDAIASGVITSKLAIPDPDFPQLQPASLDLRLGDVAYRLRASFLPGGEVVENKVEAYAMGEPFEITHGAILERNRPYLIPLVEELDLPRSVRAKTNPKSSIGRLDIFTRVITDRGHRFDEIEPGYKGKLFLEVFSRTFTVRVRAGQALNQIRLVQGDDARLTDGQIRERHAQDPLLRLGDRPVSNEQLRLSNGLFLSLDLEPNARGLVGYRAKKNSRLLDLTSKQVVQVEHFWEPIVAERPANRLILEEEEFYLLMSRESVSIPPTLAAEMTAYDPTSGELRTHYAGFFDPGFGYWEAGAEAGSRAVLEVRAHDVPFVVEHGQPVCRLAFESMSEKPQILYGKPIGSSYQGQEQLLSKYFLRGGRAGKQLKLDE